MSLALSGRTGWLITALVAVSILVVVLLARRRAGAVNPSSNADVEAAAVPGAPPGADTGAAPIVRRNIHFALGGSDGGAGFQAPEPAGHADPKAKVGDACERYRRDLDSLARRAAAEGGKVPNSPDLHRRAARIFDLERKERVYQSTVQGLEQILSSTKAQNQLEVHPGALAVELAAERKHLEDSRAGLQKERGDAVERGFGELALPDGARDVIVGLVWKQLEDETRQVLDACDHPGAPLREGVDRFVSGTALLINDMDGGHGVAAQAIVSRLLKEDRP